MLRHPGALVAFVGSSGVHSLFLHRPHVLTFSRRQGSAAAGLHRTAKFANRTGVSSVRSSMADVYEVGVNMGASLLCNGALYMGALKAGQHVLTPVALKHALALGVLLGGTVGAMGWGLCVLLFAVGSGTTRIGRSQKEAAGIAEAR
eukprot:IDg15920t1